MLIWRQRGIEAKGKMKEEEEKAKKQLDDDTINVNKQNEEKDQIINAILQVESGLTVADEIVVEGNNQLKELLTKKNASRKELQTSQSKKRRKELVEELAMLKKRKKDIEMEEKRAK